MAIDKDKSLTEAAELRRQAEKQLQTKKAKRQPPRNQEEMQRLVHELAVHQIELEMQNAELRQARDEMEDVLEKYTDLFNFAPLSYFTIDRDGLISAVNLNGARLLGIERSLLIGRCFRLFVAANSRPFFTEFLEKVFAGMEKESCEVELTTDDHQFFVQIEAVAFALRQECRVAIIDISERRRAEIALAEKQHEIEDLNCSLEKRIVQAVNDAHHKDQILSMQDRRAIMGEMIDNIAHQWRQPLNTLGLIIQKMPLFYGTAEFNQEFLEENTEMGMELIQHMSRTIDDFRNFFRPDKEKVYFSIHLVIARALSLIEKSYNDQKIIIDLRAEGTPTANGYPNEYTQILLNILKNARDALIERNIAEGRISVRAFTEDGKSIVTITDNAGGIAEESMDRIFDLYFTTKDPAIGTGIGLYMSKSIIEKNMGGRLMARNTGDGAEFRIEV